MVIGAAIAPPSSSPFVDFLQRSAHERRFVARGQTLRLAERPYPLLMSQHADSPRPIGAPHATIKPERVDDFQYRVPFGVVWKRLVRHGAGATDLHPSVRVFGQREDL